MTTNHPANGPVSLDRLHQISEILSKAAAQSDGGNLGYAMADAVKVINGAIASFGADPVAWRYRYVHTPKTEEHGSPFTTEWKLCDREDECNPSDCFERQPLYTAPPAPVVPDELLSAMEEVLRISDRDHEAWHKARNGIASCRAAMLQAGNSPVTPDGYVLVPKDMTPEMMRAVQIGSELGAYAASNLSGAYGLFTEFWDVACQAAGNSPVIPNRRVSNKVRENGFGYLHVSQGNYGELLVDYNQFIFDQGSAPENGKFIPKHMLQGIINRLQEHCDELGEEALVDIFEGLHHREGE
ncbi:TPA: hypothetical protein NBJ98_002661 [Citrobacter freundii]|nr:hypothetical protein [Citrobacter freundii]